MGGATILQKLAALSHRLPAPVTRLTPTQAPNMIHGHRRTNGDYQEEQ